MFNVGENNTRFVSVSNITMRYTFSEKVLFGDLRTSRKTGKPKTNKETGEVIYDQDGIEIPERAYAHWEGRFVGNALEPAKALTNGQHIDIINGWLDMQERTVKGKTYQNIFVVITDFVLSEPADDEEDVLPEDAVSGKDEENTDG